MIHETIAWLPGLTGQNFLFAHKSCTGTSNAFVEDFAAEHLLAIDLSKRQWSWTEPSIAA